MFIAPLIQFAVCFLILRWLLRRKPGEPFTRREVLKLLLAGAFSLVLAFLLPLERDTFFGMDPLLSGFLTAFITAGLAEEVMKYLMFRLAVRKNRKVVCRLDAVIAAVVVAAGFTLLEDLEYLVVGEGSIIRALLPGHLLFQAFMGYYYGKARVTGKFRYHVLSLAVPVLWHTAFDMFIIGIMAALGDLDLTGQITGEAVMALPYFDYVLPMLAGAVLIIIITFIALVLMLRKIGVWSRNGELREPLRPSAR